MKILLYLLALVLLFLTLLYRGSSGKGAIWKSLFTLLQLANISANNRPGAR
jgi:hypothetical protein